MPQRTRRKRKIRKSLAANDGAHRERPLARARARSRDAGSKARERVVDARDRFARVLEEHRRVRDGQRQAAAQLPFVSLVHTPVEPMSYGEMERDVTVATYNVHRWAGLNGRRAPDPARAGFVISELDADVVALQEALRPDDGDCPLEALADALGMHLAFAATRQHRRGQLGNAILSRFPISSVSVIDISHSRLERRGALAVQFNGSAGSLGVVATHLSLVDRTRHRQVKSLLEHPQLHTGPAVLLGDMNAWRRCKATRELDDLLMRHNNRDWPSSFPSARPVLALDRVYAQGAKVVSLETHDTPASRRASDHLPVIAHIKLLDTPA